MHILSAEQFDPPALEIIFDEASALREADNAGYGSRRELATRHIGKQLCSLFYEPSTRTRLSFEQAATKFGVGVVSTENAGEFSSAAKGETIEDTIKVLNEYNFDAIVLRHPETGSANKAATVSTVPIINAGDGKGEHPTQALLDMYTIQTTQGRLDNLHVVMGGDLKYGRTVRSLAQLLTKYENNSITFVSVPELQMGDDVKSKLDEHGVEYQETVEMYDAFRTADVVYWTRIQKERLEHPNLVTDNNFMIDTPALEVLPEHAVIMHPLPRVGEIDPAIDNDPRAKYFRQAGNGLYVRMALLSQILEEKEI
jgi:aspartate carbamoyltransferase catalytic subunit